MVVSAGNTGSEFPQEYPATSTNVLAIGAVDVMSQPASFTSYGNHLDLCAPGVGVRSAYPGGSYLLWSGTSMSAPFVAGAAALLLELHPRWKLDQVTNRLARSAGLLVNVSPAEVGKLGAGVLNATAALGLAPTGLLPP